MAKRFYTILFWVDPLDEKVLQVFQIGDEEAKVYGISKVGFPSWMEESNVESLKSSDDMILFCGLCSVKQSLVILNDSKLQYQSWCVFFLQCAFERIESGINIHDEL